jgi:hypothetical protein
MVARNGHWLWPCGTAGGSRPLFHGEEYHPNGRTGERTVQHEQPSSPAHRAVSAFIAAAWMLLPEAGARFRTGKRDSQEGGPRRETQRGVVGGYRLLNYVLAGELELPWFVLFPFPAKQVGADHQQSAHFIVTDLFSDVCHCRGIKFANSERIDFWSFHMAQCNKYRASVHFCLQMCHSPD